MPANTEPPHEDQPELLVEQPVALLENAPGQPAIADGQDRTQAELLAEIAERRRHEVAARQPRTGTTRGLGRLAFWRRGKAPHEPQPDDVTRRRVLRGGVALWLGAMGVSWLIQNRDQVAKEVGHKIHQGGEVKNLYSFQREFDDKMNSLPSDDAIEQAIPNRGRVINLADWRERRGINGPVNIFVINVGTSNSFAYGTDDLGHPYRQKHAAVYRAAEALKVGARRVLGIGEIKTLVLARPGAYSGEQFPGVTDEDQPRDGIMMQLEDERIQRFIDQAGPDDIIIFRYEGGFDDLRLLADTINNIEQTLNRLEEALDSDEPVSDEIRAEFKVFETRLGEIAAGFNQNFQHAAARVARYSNDRIAKAMATNAGVQAGGAVKIPAPVFFQPVWTWSLLKQARVPFGLLKKRDNDAPPPHWLKKDWTDYNPSIPRFFIELDAIREGNRLARWAWVALCEAQTAAMKQAMHDHPSLEVVPESLVGVNEEEGFYAAIAQGAIDEKGDGHPGLIEDQDARINGIDRIAMRILRVLQGFTEEGELVTADDYAEFSGRVPKRRAA